MRWLRRPTVLDPDDVLDEAEHLAQPLRRRVGAACSTQRIAEGHVQDGHGDLLGRRHLLPRTTAPHPRLHRVRRPRSATATCWPTWRSWPWTWSASGSRDAAPTTLIAWYREFAGRAPPASLAHHYIAAPSARAVEGGMHPRRRRATPTRPPRRGAPARHGTRPSAPRRRSALVAGRRASRHREVDVAGRARGPVRVVTAALRRGPQGSGRRRTHGTAPVRLSAKGIYAVERNVARPTRSLLERRGRCSSSAWPRCSTPPGPTTQWRTEARRLADATSRRPRRAPLRRPTQRSRPRTDAAPGGRADRDVSDATPAIGGAMAAAFDDWPGATRIATDTTRSDVPRPPWRSFGAVAVTMTVRADGRRDPAPGGRRRRPPRVRRSMPELRQQVRHVVLHRLLGQVHLGRRSGGW